MYQGYPRTLRIRSPRSKINSPRSTYFFGPGFTSSLLISIYTVQSIIEESAKFFNSRWVEGLLPGSWTTFQAAERAPPGQTMAFRRAERPSLAGGWPPNGLRGHWKTSRLCRPG